MLGRGREGDPRPRSREKDKEESPFGRTARLSIEVKEGGELYQRIEAKPPAKRAPPPSTMIPFRRILSG
jgi:hypothetical protein